MWKRLKSNPAYIIIFILFLSLLLFVIIGPMIHEKNPRDQNLLLRLLPPGSRVEQNMSWLGTDYLGRDMMARLMHGGRITLSLSFIALVFAAIVGTVLAIWAGFSKGIVDTFVFNAMNIQLSIPTLILAITLAGIIGKSFRNLVFVLAITSWVPIARIVRAEAMSVTSQDYIEAARATGSSSLRIMGRHILPNVTSSIFITCSLQLARIILAETSLSFLGLGAPNAATWGTLLADARAYMTTAWWIAVFPGACTFLLVLGINLIGDFFRDVLDPKLSVQQ